MDKCNNKYIGVLHKYLYKGSMEGRVPLKVLVEMYKNGAIQSYEHNRGNLNVNKKGIKENRVREFDNDFFSNGLGMIVLSDDYPHIICDGNHRMELLCRRLEEGKSNGSDLILFQLIPSSEFFRTHQVRNNTMPHNTKQTLLNPDHPIGKELADVINSSQYKGWQNNENKSGLLTTHISQLSNIYYALCNDIELHYSDVFTCRAKIQEQKFATSLPNTFVLSEDKTYKLIEALNYYKQFIYNFTLCYNSQKGDVVKKIKKASFFGLLLVDYLGKQRFTWMTPKLLANQAFKSGSRLSEVCSSITAGSIDDIDRTYDVITKLLLKGRKKGINLVSV